MFNVEIEKTYFSHNKKKDKILFYKNVATFLFVSVSGE